MNITAIVPVWNGCDLLARLIASLELQTLPAAELLVVDNGSTDGAPEFARSHGARVISMGRNAGFAAAVNRGIGESRTGAIAVLNSDVELAPDYFAKLASHNAWFATGKLLSADSPKFIDGTFDAVCRGGTAWRVGAGRPDGPEFSRPRAIHSAPFTAALFRAELFERIGTLEERFESYLEDVDFGLRCAAQGIEGVYDPSAVAYHCGSATLGRWHQDTVRRIARNQIWLVARHYPPSLKARWVWPIFVAHSLWSAVAFRHRAGRAWLRGIYEGLSGMSKLPYIHGHKDYRVLERILLANDHEIYSIQSSTGFDSYWRLYFKLTTGGA